MTDARTPLVVALGRTPRTDALFTGEVSDPALPLELPAMPSIIGAFPAMVREGRWPVSEMAIATFLMAKEAGRPLVLLPCVLASRAQEGSLLCREDSPLRGPHQLRGARVGVRAYSQTTGMWLRGVLAESHGVPPDQVRWITFEEAHLADFRDPPWCERVAAGATLEGMLREGVLDAAVFGSGAPAGFRTVFPKPAEASKAFLASHGFVPVNHLLIARSDVARDRAPELMRLLSLLGASGASVTTRAALAPALSLAARWCAEQRLTRRALALSEIWSGTPHEIG
ncbi:substrate-binding domain-containing protein [Sabulicella glaciei]|uniref:ABC transporter substrate-binding protein n=1 Tax=Sabulicella glaciei TaxID=2984948 RepID=A0ABT3P216_9PROT|nr:ABC transporter substrate-binding protein [Roseococcus sp. MDT2-1-1]MCW8088455.1 ABC transporter substrate-binding protein [Roseococcus sp. MDT2-1-1]